MRLGADHAVLGTELQHADEAQRPVQAQHLHGLSQPRRRGQIHDLPAAAHAFHTCLSEDASVMIHGPPQDAGDSRQHMVAPMISPLRHMQVQALLTTPDIIPLLHAWMANGDSTTAIDGEACSLIRSDHSAWLLMSW